VITLQPAALLTKLAWVITSATPRGRDIEEVRRQLLERKARLGLQDQVAAEYVAESFFRCAITDYVQRRFQVDPGAVPESINSSHKATRGVCWRPSQHRHQQIADGAWTSAWRLLQKQYPAVNVRDREAQPAKRADLYLVAQRKVVSVEFKYVGPHGVRDVSACAAQMRRYVEKHAATLLVIYDGARRRDEVPGMGRLRNCLGPTVPVIVVPGPEIPA
jgi:hypothetical protein